MVQQKCLLYLFAMTSACVHRVCSFVPICPCMCGLTHFVALVLRPTTQGTMFPKPNWKGPKQKKKTNLTLTSPMHFEQLRCGLPAMWTVPGVITFLQSNVCQGTHRLLQKDDVGEEDEESASILKGAPRSQSNEWNSQARNARAF